MTNLIRFSPEDGKRIEDTHDEEQPQRRLWSLEDERRIRRTDERREQQIREQAARLGVNADDLRAAVEGDLDIVRMRAEAPEMPYEAPNAFEQGLAAGQMPLPCPDGFERYADVCEPICTGYDDMFCYDRDAKPVAEEERPAVYAAGGYPARRDRPHAQTTYPYIGVKAQLVRTGKAFVGVVKAALKGQP